MDAVSERIDEHDRAPVGVGQTLQGSDVAGRVADQRAVDGWQEDGVARYARSAWPAAGRDRRRVGPRERWVDGVAALEAHALLSLMPQVRGELGRDQVRSQAI